MPVQVTISEVLRSEAHYRISFSEVGADSPDVIGCKVRDVLATFPAAEIRITAADGLVAFVSIPADVMPEALDRKASALREQWATKGPLQWPECVDTVDTLAAYLRSKGT